MACTSAAKFSFSSLLKSKRAQSCSWFIIFSLSTLFSLLCASAEMFMWQTQEGWKKCLRSVTFTSCDPRSTSESFKNFLNFFPLKSSANFSPSVHRLVRHAGDGDRLRRLHHGQRHGALPHPVTDAPQSNSQHVHHQQRDWGHRHRGRRPGQGGQWSLATSQQHEIPSSGFPVFVLLVPSTARSQPITKTPSSVVATTAGQLVWLFSRKTFLIFLCRLEV